jgi:hypothetical protein
VSASPERLLEIYLSDHAAAAMAGSALARRTARSNASTSLGEPLRKLADEIEEDRRTLKRVIAALGFRQSRAKEALAWAGERAGRLKPNGQLAGYSPLSRVLELEALSVGIAGKLALWESLQMLTHVRSSLSDVVDLEELATRARRQRDEVEELRRRAVSSAFGSAG